LAGPHPVKEKTVTVTVAQYVPTPDALTQPTPHYAMPDRACAYTDAKGKVTKVYCGSQLTDALNAESGQVDACNIDKACVRALERGEKCQTK
jgi:hypothetical protein